VGFLRKIFEKVKEEKYFFLLFALLVVLTSALYRPLQYVQNFSQVSQSSNQGEKSSQKRNYESPIVDINTASIETLQTLPGIGPSKAKAIIDSRSKKPFTKPEDLKNVPGIGDKTYEKLKDRIKVTVNLVNAAQNTDGKQIQQMQCNTTIDADRGQLAEEQKIEKININTANEEELQTLPGIGPAKAQAIIDYRKNSGGFKSIEELKNVKGIGEKTYEKLKNLITINGN
jgi:competence protein ComEA